MQARELFGALPTPKGLLGEKRPADAISLALMTGKTATGEIEEVRDAN